MANIKTWQSLVPPTLLNPILLNPIQAAENKVLREAAQLAMDALDTCKETMTGTRFRYRDYDERRVASAKAALKGATNG